MDKKRIISRLISFTLVVGISVSFVLYDRNFERKYASIDDIQISFRRLSKIGTDNFTLQGEIEYPVGYTISAYVPQNTNVNISELYLIHNVKYLCFNSDSKYLLHSHYCEEIKPVGITFVEYKKDSTQIYLYSSNKLKISKIKYVVEYQGNIDEIYSLTNPDESFATHCLILNEYLNYLNFICYDSEGNEVYRYK